jgi:hypothetical protein
LNNHELGFEIGIAENYGRPVDKNMRTTYNMGIGGLYG